MQGLFRRTRDFAVSRVDLPKRDGGRPPVRARVRSSDLASFPGTAMLPQLILHTAVVSVLLPFAGSMPAIPATPAASSVSGDREAQPTRPGLVTRLADVRAIPRAARGCTALIHCDRGGLERFAATGGGLLTDFPLGPHASATLALTPMEPFSADATLALGSGAAMPLRAQGAFLQGQVAGDPASSVFLSVSDAGTFGFVATAERQYVISSGPRSLGLPTACVDLTAMPPGLMDPPAWSCGSGELARLVGGAAGEATDADGSDSGEGGVAGATCRQIRIAYDTDYEFFQLFGGSVSTATAYVATVTAALNTIYTRDLSARISSSYLRLWPESDDPWDQTTTVSQLLQCRSLWLSQGGAVSRDLVHILSGRGLGGGVAYLPGLCSSNGYGLSANLAGYFPTPLVNNSGQNWDIYVVAHEVGHNFGMPHTHEMTPIVDGCGSDPSDCTVAQADAGTIMSYCHLCPGGLTNIRLEFHPASIARSESFLSGLACSYSGASTDPVAAADAVDAFPGVPRAIDVLANEVDMNCESIVISSFPATSALGATLTRSVGTGAGGRDEILYEMPTGGAVGTDAFSYTVTDASGDTATATVTLRVARLRIPENPTGPTPQVDARYYIMGSETALPDFGARTPYAIGTVGQLNFPLTFNTFATSGRADAVGARFSGWLSVPSNGIWRLYTSSDEGSRLSIGDTVVVDNDGIHGVVERSGEIALGAGLHAITVDYFERTGSAALVVSWQAPNGVKQVIPSGQFFRGGNNIPQDLTNDGIVDALDVAILLSNWGQVDSPYDLTGDGLINGADIASILFAWTE